MTAIQIKKEKERAEKRLKFLLHPDNARVAKIRTIVKLKEEIDFLEKALKGE
jgi:hypothetical protein